MDYQSNYSSLGPGFEPDPKENQGRIPLWVLLFVACSLLLAVISMLRFPKIFSEYRSYIKAEQRIASGKGETGQALRDLMAVVEEHPDSVPMITKLIDLSMEEGYYELAAYVFDSYLVGKDLTDSQYSRMMGYSARLETYFATYDAIEDLAVEINALPAGSEEEAAAVRAQAREGFSRLLKDSGYDSAMLYYTMSFFTETMEERYDCLQKGYEADPECYDIRTELGNAARVLGKLEEAEEYLDQALAKERSDSGALRGKAIVCLLKGDSQAALDYAQEAYAADPDGTYVRDTYLIALHVNGDTKEEGYIRAELEAEQGTLDEDTLRFLEGQCTLQEYYME